MFRFLTTIIRELYLYLTKVRYVCGMCVMCSAHNTHAALRHAATSPNIFNDVILPSVLT